MIIFLSLKNNKFFRAYLDICSIAFIVVLFYVMFFFHSGIWSAKYYAEPLFDRTSTYDHTISVIAYFALFFITFYKTKKPLISVLLPTFIFGIGNMFADTLLLHYYFLGNYFISGLWTFDYITPFLACLVIVYFEGKRMFKYFLLQIAIMSSWYSTWSIFLPNFIDCGKDIANEYNCSVHGALFFNPAVNLLIVSIWVINFTSGYFILSRHISRAKEYFKYEKVSKEDKKSVVII